MSSSSMHRRQFLQAATGIGLSGAQATLAVGARAQPPNVQSSTARSKIRIVLPSPGTAGAVWKPLIDRLGTASLRGVELEWITSDPGRMQVQLTAGSLDVGVFGPIGLAALRRRGVDIVLFGPGTTNHSVWLVKQDSPFRKPSDLIGRRVATQPETSETYQQARIAASLTGIDLKKDIDVVYGPPTANLALFERGDVDAVIILEPTATRLAAAGAREIGRVGTLWREATGEASDPYLIGLAAQRRWVEENRETASRLARLFADANQLILDKPTVLREIRQHIGVRENEHRAIELLPQRAKVAYSAEWNERVWASIDRQVEVAVKVGLLPERPARPLYDGVPLITA